MKIPNCKGCDQKLPLLVLDEDGTLVTVSGRPAKTVGHAVDEYWWPCPRAFQPDRVKEPAQEPDPSLLAIGEWSDRIERAVFGKTGNTMTPRQIAVLRAELAAMYQEAASPRRPGATT